MQLDLAPLLGGITKTVAAAVIVGGGAAVLDAQRDNGIQDERIAKLQDEQKVVIAQMTSLKVSLDEANKNVSTLNGYIQGMQRGNKKIESRD